MNTTKTAYPHLTVAAVIERNGQFLCVEEIAQEREVINQPAGHVEPGESIIDAVKREVIEETRWAFNPTHIIGLYSHISTHSGVSYHRICFGGDLEKEYPDHVLDKEIIQPIWLTRTELTHHSDRLRSELVITCVDDYLSGHHYPLSLIANFIDH